MASKTSLSGFVEWLPDEQLIQEHFLATIRSKFELFGFTPLDLRAIEPLSVLLSKGETDKEIYVLKRLHAGKDEGDKGLGLHYDLTVPFARFVSENAGRLVFPVKRYQIQKAWRGERPQDGRYREFIQADIDVVARDDLQLHFDVELPSLLLEILDALPIPPVTLLVNNRKLMEGFYRGLGIEDIHTTLRIVDKIDKAGRDKVATMLGEHLDAATIDQVIALSEIRAPDASFAEQVRALGVSHPMLDEGLAELVAVMTGNTHLRPGGLVADLRIARGFDYYTGTVYEGSMEGFEDKGSVCSGGRYDNLVSDAGGKGRFPGVGVSIGVTRILGLLIGAGQLAASRQTPTTVLVALNNEEHRPAAAHLARQLRARGIATEVFHTPSKYGKQIRYADRKGIPYVWFAEKSGPGIHEVRNLDTGDQEAADPTAWQPDPSLARPGVTRT